MKGGKKTQGLWTPGQCMVEGCPNTRRANNLCNPHYLKLYFRNQPGNEYDRGRKWFRRESIAHEIAPLLGMSTENARRLVRVILNVVIEGIRSGEEVSIPGFGYFGIDNNKVYFWPARELKSLVNKYYGGPDGPQEGS